MHKTKLTKKEMMLFLFPLGLLASPLVAPYIDLRGDALDRAIRRRVGYVQDCGTVPLGGNPASAEACIVAAFQAKRSFRVRYEYVGKDSQGSTAIASTTQGKVYFYYYETHPSQTANGESVKERQVTPYIHTANGKQELLLKNLKETKP